MEGGPADRRKGTDPLKKMGEEPGWKWRYSVAEGNYLSHLWDVAYSLKMIYPDCGIENKEEELEERLLKDLRERGDKYVLLYELLLEGMVKLHYGERHLEGDCWLVERSDIMRVIRLLQPEVWPLSLLSADSRRVYQDLLIEFYPEDFSIRQSMMRLRISKSSLHRHFKMLEKSNYIERVGGDKRNGYLYNVGERGK